MELVLIIIILILLIANLVVVLTKNNRLQTERLELLLHEEMKANREELGRNIRELRSELNQTLNFSVRQMQDSLHKNMLTGNEMQREKFEAMGKQQDALIKSTEKRLDDMRMMVEEKLQKTLNERIGQSFEIVRTQLENVQKGLGEMKSLAQDVGGLKKVLSNVKTRGTFGEVQLGALLDQMLSPEQYEANVKIFIGKQKFKNITETYNNEEINLYQRLITTYSEVIKSKKLINESIKGSKMNYLQDKYKNINYDLLMENLTVNPIANTQIIEIKYKSLNPQQSYDLLYSITENLISYSKELYPNVNITILEQVHVNLNQLMNKKLTIIGLGLILGLIVGIGGIIGVMYLNNTYKNQKSLEEEIGLTVIGVIPKID